MAAEKQYGSGEAVWQRRSSMAAEKQYGSGEAVWQRRSSMAAEKQYGSGEAGRSMAAEKQYGSGGRREPPGDRSDNSRATAMRSNGSSVGISFR